MLKNRQSSNRADKHKSKTSDYYIASKKLWSKFNSEFLETESKTKVSSYKLANDKNNNRN